MVESLENAAELFDRWWVSENSEALIYYQYPKHGSEQTAQKSDADVSFVRTPVAFNLTFQDGDWQRLEDLLKMIEPQVDNLGFLGAAFPRYLPSFGPGCIAPFISGYSKVCSNSIWFELGGQDSVLSLEEVAETPVDAINDYAKLALSFTERVAETLYGQMLISMTDLGGNLDLLSALCGSTELLMDLASAEDEVHAALERLDQLWLSWYKRFDDIVAPASHGLRGCWMQLISRQPFYCLQSDFAAMISPGMFKQFVSPSLSRIATGLGRAVFHLDGPGMVGHLPHVCDIPEIHAIQWTPGAGNPDVEDPAWYDFYSEIIDRGKKVILLCFPPDPDLLKRLFSKLPREAFFLHIEGPDRITGEQILKI